MINFLDEDTIAQETITFLSVDKTKQNSDRSENKDNLTETGVLKTRQLKDYIKYY